MRAVAASFLLLAGWIQDPPAPPEEPQPLDEKKLAAPPVDEPEWPLPETEEEILKLGHTPIPGGGYQFERRSSDGSLDAGAVVPGRIMMNRGLIELLGCGEGGKEHESVLRIDCDIQSLDLALTLGGFVKGPVPAKPGEGGAEGSRVVVLVQWREGGRTVTRRAEDLVINVVRGAPMSRVGWTYVASLLPVDDPAVPGKMLDQRVLAATGTRSFLTISWNFRRDGATLFDNPLPEALDDTTYIANYAVLPPPGTPVAVILRAPTKAEREEIARLEKESR